jgi:hypothetical protein
MRTRRLVSLRQCRRQAAGVCFIAITSLWGCGDGRIATYPVVGSVLVDGRPAEGALVILVPTTTAEAGGDRERPFGMTDAEGKFSLTTFDPGDGAPAGEYKVLVQWPAPNNSPEAARGGGRAALGPDRLKGKYFKLDTTTLAATVEEQSNELPPFGLTSR